MIDCINIIIAVITAISNKKENPRTSKLLFFNLWTMQNSSVVFFKQRFPFLQIALQRDIFPF
jgi:hypothetical protein